MTLSDHKYLYQRFLEGHEGKLHFAAHSHHFWPDVTRDAHLEYWDDCSKSSDEKWQKIFSKVVPEFQSHVASILNIKHPEQIVFAPNTHELTARLLSLFIGRSRLNILTTSSEFHSWRRQIQRISEISSVRIDVASAENFLTNRRELIENLKEKLQLKPDLFFVSQVFFDSGLALTDLELVELCDHCPKETLMVVDGYHGFAALPTDLSQLEGKIFYLGGGYKYAQAGEGAAFMIVPKGDWRPVYTGWFAEFGDLSRPSEGQVGYTQDGFSFLGATQDTSGLYRFNAVWNLFRDKKLQVQDIHQWVRKLQLSFLEQLGHGKLLGDLVPLFAPDLPWHGHFLTYDAPSEKRGAEVQEALKRAGIMIDRRGTRIRFGFGLYQNSADVLELTTRLKNLAF